MNSAPEQKSFFPPTVKRPKPNPFFAALASSQGRSKPATPLQRYRTHMANLKKMAEGGDVMGWNRSLSELTPLAHAARIVPEKDLDTRVELKKLELTLLLEAGKKALAQAKTLQKKAEEERGKDEKIYSELVVKAEKLNELSLKLNAQLQAKMK